MLCKLYITVHNKLSHFTWPGYKVTQPNFDNCHFMIIFSDMETRGGNYMLHSDITVVTTARSAHTDGLVQKRCYSIANTLKLCISCIKLSIWHMNDFSNEDIFLTEELMNGDKVTSDRNLSVLEWLFGKFLTKYIKLKSEKQVHILWWYYLRTLDYHFRWQEHLDVFDHLQ